MEHKYAGPTVNADRSITHACVCGLTSDNVQVIVDHGLDMIEQAQILAELQRRNPSEKWT